MKTELNQVKKCFDKKVINRNINKIRLKKPHETNFLILITFY